MTVNPNYPSFETWQRQMRFHRGNRRMLKMFEDLNTMAQKATNELIKLAFLLKGE